MKKLLIITVLSVFALNISAQETPALDSVMQANYNAEKKALIKEAVQLNDEEAKEFWPLYQEYNNKLQKINKEIVSLINNNADKLETLTDDEAEDIWEKKMDLSSDLVKLEKKYFKKMKRVLPAGKVVRYFQAENKIKALMSAQMAIEVPLMDTK